MELLELTNKGWSEIIIDSDCEVYKFFKIADVMETKLRIAFGERVKMVEEVYWPFNAEGKDLILFYRPNEGVGMYAAAKSASDEQTVAELYAVAKTVAVHLNDFDWIATVKGQTIGTLGENKGVILADISNLNGARISLEKDVSGGPFTIAYELYGWLKKNHLEHERKNADEFIFRLKVFLNSFFDLYDIPESKRKDNWQKKHDQLLTAIADLRTVYEQSAEFKKEPPAEKPDTAWWKKILRRK